MGGDKVKLTGRGFVGRCGAESIVVSHPTSACGSSVRNGVPGSQFRHFERHR